LAQPDRAATLLGSISGRDRSGPFATEDCTDMSRFSRFGPSSSASVTQKSAKGKLYVDWKDADTLRRMMSPNGKIYARKRLGLSAREQRMVAQAIKRARYMGLLPYTSATM